MYCLWHSCLCKVGHQSKKSMRMGECAMEGFNYIEILLPLIILELILVIVALVDLSKRDKSSLRGENKLVWVLVILFISTIGPIIYLVMGRKKG